MLLVLVGYLAGVATAVLVAMLRPSPEAGTGAQAWSPQPAPVPAVATPSRPASPSEVPQHAAAPLSAEAQSRVAPLQAKLADDPSDMLARKQLAVILLQNQQLMLAYEHATRILNTQPGDPDGLYVHGVVRLAMGHGPKAIELFDQVLERYPNHVLALQGRAQAQRKIGDEGGAALTEERARQAALGDGSTAPVPGDGSEVQALVTAAVDGTLLEMMRSSEPAPPAISEDAGD